VIGEGSNEGEFLVSRYGLLGASGCGKTTVLQSIMGQRKLSKGCIRVFGVQPNTPGSGVPGQAVGYMPQVSKLFDIFF